MKEIRNTKIKGISEVFLIYKLTKQLKGKLKKEPLSTYIINDGKKEILYIKVDKDEETIRNAIVKALNWREKVQVHLSKAIDKKREIYIIIETFELFKFKHNYKTKKENKKYELYILEKSTRKLEEIVREAKIIAQSQNYGRKLVNTPPNIGTADYIVKEVKKFAKDMGFNCKILDKKMLKKKGFNTFLAVNEASAYGAYLVKLTYKPKTYKKKIAIVGKGVTFDTGGLGLKPSTYMYSMHLDKSGAIAVLGIMRAIKLLKLNVMVEGYLALTDNAIGPKAIQPNAIVKAYNGKTVEILHTDAEGRLILADTLAYASEQKYDYIFDLATLTGAMSVSLGKYAIGVFTQNEKLGELIKKIGLKIGEKAWPFPMWKEYEEMLKSEVADIKNLGSWKGEAGSITAAKFLEFFVKDKKKWVHLDIASMMDTEKHPYFGSGGICPGVRLVVHTIKELV